eukprot:TRINITY_DN7933_c0_g3_i1.p1 TRINITY_DN7933_c0_g3~~TRINITY_DN7933_c0_g3_i1.p1  ORF type:complete len:161 (-),score=38.97 TRINITY_DN7933_c0_g3_i1:35-517(-)
MQTIVSNETISAKHFPTITNFLKCAADFIPKTITYQKNKGEFWLIFYFAATISQEIAYFLIKDLHIFHIFLDFFYEQDLDDLRASIILRYREHSHFYDNALKDEREVARNIKKRQDKYSFNFGFMWKTLDYLLPFVNLDLESDDTPVSYTHLTLPTIYSV